MDHKRSLDISLFYTTIEKDSEFIQYSTILKGIFCDLAHLSQTVGWLFVIGRLMHGICFGFMKQNMTLRVGGTLLSFLIISVLAINLLLNI